MSESIDTIHASHTSELLADLADIARTIPPLDWLSGNARDAVRIAVCIAGFDCKELVTRLAKVRTRHDRMNVATVYRVMSEIADEKQKAIDTAHALLATQRGER